MSNVNAIYSFTGEYQFLSNMYTCDIEYGGFKYPCVENAFQAQKTVDEKEKLLFLYVSPYIACKIGKRIQIRSDWKDIRLKIMEDLIRMKFSNSELSKLLKNTDDRPLVYANLQGDNFWGVYNPEKGQNNLGKILMKIRSEL